MFAYINYEFLEPQLSIYFISGWSDWVYLKDLKMRTADFQAVFQKIISSLNKYLIQRKWKKKIHWHPVSGLWKELISSVAEGHLAFPSKWGN